MKSLGKRECSTLTKRNYGDDLTDFGLWWENEGHPTVQLSPASIDDEDLREWKRWLKEEPLNSAGWTEDRWHRLQEQNRAKHPGYRAMPFVASGRTRKPGSINTKLATLKSFLGWCKKSGFIAEKPEMPKRAASAPQAVKALDEEKQKELLREARAHRNKRTWPTVYVMVETGLRLAELVALRRKDLVISERRGELLVRAGKGCKSRTLPIDPELRRVFKALLGPGSDPEDPVFTSQRKDASGRSKPLTGRGIQEILDRLKERLRWDELHPHMLRHTFAMNLRRAGTDWPVIARLMGHASVVTTMMCYGTPAERDLVKAMNRHGNAEDD